MARLLKVSRSGPGTGSPLADLSAMAASLPFCSPLPEDVLGGDPLRVLPPPPIPTLLEKHLGQLRSFYQSAPAEPTNGGLFYRTAMAGSRYTNLLASRSAIDV